ncbi:MAG: uridine kinase [Armatimonadetes bacterium]|nr:uridine kinase [Armatimonadota bacterium]
MTDRLVIGVAGGTGSGKSTVARKLINIFAADQVRLIPQDAYYRDNSHLPPEERKKRNYDHPLAFDNDLLIAHLDALTAGKAVHQPLYDFVTHSRLSETREVSSTQILIVEGILVLEDARLRDRMDIKVYVDTDSDERFIRRLRRDIFERGRTVESVIEQYLNSVRPMHLQFVEPTKRYADVIVPEGGANVVAIDLLAVKIRSILERMGRVAIPEGL